METERIERQIDGGTPPYPVCRNCGTRLEGMYCHKCGQYASEQTTLMKDFVSEYLSNTYPIDTKIIPTIKQLIRRPGYVTNEFLAGKRDSYVHPLKLNLFLLFVVITVLVFFSVKERADSKFMSTISNDVVVSHLALMEAVNDSTYAEKLKMSPRDTVTLLLSNASMEGMNEFITVLEARISEGDFSYDTLLVDVPEVLIEDGLIAMTEGDLYTVVVDSDMVTAKDDLDFLAQVWSRMSDLIVTYLPLIILLTCPVMTLVIRLFNLKKYRNYMHCFVFSLHYTAFLEIFIFLVYLFTRIFNISGGYVLLWLIFGLTTLYMAFAVKRVFGDKNLLISGAKALMINVFYSLLVLLVFIFILVLSIILTFV